MLMNRIRILIIHSQSIIALDMKAVLEKKGFRVFYLNQPDIDKISDINPRLILLEYSDKFSGGSKKLSKLFDIPVIILSPMPKNHRYKTGLEKYFKILNVPYLNEDLYNYVTSELKRNNHYGKYY